MKQIEIDGHIGNWFNKRDSLKEAQSNLERAQIHFRAATEQCAKALMPRDARKEERYIFPTTDGRGIVAYLEPVEEISVPGGEIIHSLKPTCLEHKFR